MDELEISGKRYISTRLAGKEHNYHADYIGQLIRGGKVAGQKVGRSWYVDAKSLATYLKGESVPQAAPMPVKAKVEIIEEPSETVITDNPVEEEKIEADLFEEEPKPEEKSETRNMTLRRSHLMPRPLMTEEKKEIKKTIQEKAEKKESVKETSEFHQVPITIVGSPRLRYVEEEKPLFPATLKKTSRTTSQILNTPVEREVIEEEIIIRPDSMPRQVRRMRVMRAGLSILITGCITLAIMAALSAYVVSVTTIKGDTASAGYTLEAYSASF